MSPHLILGPTGAFGSAILRELRRRGEPVRVLVRDPARLGGQTDVEVVQGDARVLSTVLEAAKDCQSIFQGINTPLSRWMPELVRAHENAVEASGLSGATLVFPGSMLGLRPIFGVPLPPASWAPMHLDEVSPFGRIRQDLEAQLQQNSELREVRSIIVRSPDWFGPGVDNPLVGPMFRAARVGRPVPWLRDAGVSHLFAYVEDVARVTVELLLRRDRPVFEVFNVGGHLVDGQSWATALGKAAGHPGLKPTVRGGLGLKLLALVDPEAAHLQHHSHLWEGPMLLNDRATRELLPGIEPTPLEEALARSFTWFAEHP